RQDLRAGISAVTGTPWLWISILVFTMTNLTLGGPYSIALPFLVEQQLSGDVRMLGLIYAAFPVGYVLGGIWLGYKQRIRHRGPLAYGGIIIAGVGMLCFGLPLPVAALLVAALFNGAALEISSQI